MAIYRLHSSQLCVILQILFRMPLADFNRGTRVGEVSIYPSLSTTGERDALVSKEQSADESMYVIETE